MKSQGPQPQRQRPAGAYSELAREAIENPNEWVEQEVLVERKSGDHNRFAYALALLLCDMTQRNGVLYVRYHGPVQQQEET